MRYEVKGIGVISPLRNPARRADRAVDVMTPEENWKANQDKWAAEAEALGLPRLFPGWLKEEELAPVEAEARTHGLFVDTYQLESHCVFIRYGRPALDPVTSLPNWAAFAEQLERYNDHRAFAVVVADIVGMNALARQYGHAAANTIIASVAAALRPQRSPDEFLARHRAELGDEFLFLLPGSDRRQASERKAALRRLLPSVQVDRPSTTVKVRYVAYARAGDEKPADVLKKAIWELSSRKRQERDAKPRTQQ